MWNSFTFTLILSCLIYLSVSSGILASDFPIRNVLHILPFPCAQWQKSVLFQFELSACSSGLLRLRYAIERHFQHREYVASDGGAIHEYGTQWSLPIDVLSLLFSEISEESCRKSSVSRDDVLAEVWTENLPEASLDCYQCASPVCRGLHSAHARTP